MKRIILFLLIFFFIFIQNIYSQDNSENYINYYAVDNSLDGQPMIERMNILRFFPVFWIHEKVTKVEVTLYYGKDIFKKNADSCDHKKYWQILLPSFSLGQAIQRIEVEMVIKLPKKVKNEYLKEIEEMRGQVNVSVKNSVNKLKTLIEISFKTKEERINKLMESVREVQNTFNNISQQKVGEIAKTLDINQRSIDTQKNLLDEIQSSITNFKSAETSKIINELGELKDESLITKNINETVKNANDSRSALKNKIISTRLDLIESALRHYEKVDFNKMKNNFEYLVATIKDLQRKFADNSYPLANIRTDIESIKNSLELTKNYLSDLKLENISLNTNMQNLVDSIPKLILAIDTTIFYDYNKREKYKTKFFEELTSGLGDTSFVGQSVSKSDLIIDENMETARILYRNYKSTLRKMPALDPAETLGIFRVRYIPFPVTATSSSDRIQMIPFSGDNSMTVFEFGVGFGDVIFPGDEFIVPQFSANRLGISIALSQKLFASDADLKALALTYELNTYASIGLGGNFAKNLVRPYFSFGINKKAFEALLKGIVGIFR
jgi:hypothetical protein